MSSELETRDVGSTTFFLPHFKKTGTWAPQGENLHQSGFTKLNEKSAGGHNNNKNDLKNTSDEILIPRGPGDVFRMSFDTNRNVYFLQSPMPYMVSPKYSRDIREIPTRASKIRGNYRGNP